MKSNVNTAENIIVIHGIGKQLSDHLFPEYQQMA
jgi:hypothetical protein